jgi:hypothetical protein
MEAVTGEESGVLLRVGGGGWMEGENRVEGADADVTMLDGREDPRLRMRSARVVGSAGADDGGIGSMLD